MLDGTTYNADLVIGADGIRSTVRNAVVDPRGPQQGETCVREQTHLPRHDFSRSSESCRRYPRCMLSAYGVARLWKGQRAAVVFKTSIDGSDLVIYIVNGERIPSKIRLWYVYIFWSVPLEVRALSDRMLVERCSDFQHSRGWRPSFTRETTPMGAGCRAARDARRIPR